MKVIAGVKGFVAHTLPQSIHAMWQLIDRLPPNTCWEWQGYTHAGYGAWSFLGREEYVHRFIYRLYAGEIPQGLEIDHLCRNPRCVNPAHLEVVTHRENIRRAYAQRLTCRHGHPLDGFRGRGSRYCLTCNRLRVAAVKKNARDARTLLNRTQPEGR